MTGTEYPKWIEHPVEGRKIVYSEDEEIESAKQGWFGRSTKMGRIQYLESKRDLLMKDVEAIDIEIEGLRKEAKDEAFRQAQAKQDMAVKLQGEAKDLTAMYADEPEIPVVEGKGFPCTVCDKICLSELGLAAHMRTHKE